MVVSPFTNWGNIESIPAFFIDIFPSWMEAKMIATATTHFKQEN